MRSNRFYHKKVHFYDDHEQSKDLSEFFYSKKTTITDSKVALFITYLELIGKNLLIVAYR